MDGNVLFFFNCSDFTVKVPTNDGKPGRILINSLDITKYFKSVDDIKTTIIPLKLVRRLGEFNIWCVVENGGSSSQAEALMVAIARGLCVHDPLLKPLLETGINNLIMDTELQK